MDKGPDYERIRAMLSGKQGQPQVTPPEEADEQSWIGRYLRLAEQFISGPFKPRVRLFEFPRPSAATQTETKPEQPTSSHRKDVA